MARPEKGTTYSVTGAPSMSRCSCRMKAMEGRGGDVFNGGLAVTVPLGVE